MNVTLESLIKQPSTDGSIFVKFVYSKTYLEKKKLNKTPKKSKTLLYNIKTNLFTKCELTQ